MKKIKNLLSAFFKPQKKIMFYYRISKWLYDKKYYFLSILIQDRQAKYGCYISPKSIIDNTLTLKHSVGVVIGEGVIIEENVCIWLPNIIHFIL